MRIGFRKRVTILPGVRLNLSRAGVSATVGIPGLSLNIGKKGAYVNTGIPGTGLYSRSRISGEASAAAVDRPDVPNDRAGLGPGMVSGNTTEIRSKDAGDIRDESMAALASAIEEARRLKPLISEQVDRARVELHSAWFLRVVWSLLIVGLLVPWFRRTTRVRRHRLDVLRQAVEDCCVDVDVDLGTRGEALWGECVTAFQEVSRSDQLLDVTASTSVDSVVERSTASAHLDTKPARWLLSSLAFVRSSKDAMCLENRNGPAMGIFPGLLLLCAGGEYGVVGLERLEVTFEREQLIERRETVPRDGRVVGRTWAVVNKDGSPDRRRADNYEELLVEYGGIRIQSESGVNERYLASNAAAAERFVKALRDFREYWNSEKPSLGDDTPDMTAEPQPEPSRFATAAAWFGAVVLPWAIPTALVMGIWVPRWYGESPTVPVCAPYAAYVVAELEGKPFPGLPVRLENLPDVARARASRRETQRSSDESRSLLLADLGPRREVRVVAAGSITLDGHQTRVVKVRTIGGKHAGRHAWALAQWTRRQSSQRMKKAAAASVSPTPSQQQPAPKGTERGDRHNEKGIWE